MNSPRSYKEPENYQNQVNTLQSKNKIDKIVQAQMNLLKKENDKFLIQQNLKQRENFNLTIVKPLQEKTVLNINVEKVELN